MIALAVYLLALGLIGLGARHRIATWASHHLTKRRVVTLVSPLVATRDEKSTLDDLARSLRAHVTLRSSVIADAMVPGSLFPSAGAARLSRGDVLRDVCRDEFANVDERVVTAIELADLSGLNAADVLDVAANSIRQEENLALLARSAGSHARSTVSVLTACSLLALAISIFLSDSVRTVMATPSGLFLVAIGVACNVAARLWITRESARSTRHDADSRRAREIILTLESLVLAGYSLQGALMTAHTWIRTRSPHLTHVAELLHAGHTVETALDHLSGVDDEHLRRVAHCLQLAHRDGGPIHSMLASLRDEITRHEEHRLTASIQRTPVRLVVPLVACALPSFLCIGVIPIFVAIFGGLTNSNGV